MSRSEQKKKEREAAIRRRLRKQAKEAASPMTAAPIQTFKQVPKDKRAVAILRRLEREAKKPETRMPYDLDSSPRRLKVISAAGIESSATREPIPNTDGSRRHDVDFSRSQADDIFEPRKNVSPKNAALRRANIKYQQGVLLDQMKTNDLVTATPLEGSGKHNARARIYSRMTNGALTAQPRSNGDLHIASIRSGPDTFFNKAKGQVKFDPKALMKDLTSRAAAKAIIKRLAGPKAQALMLLDEGVEAATGTRLSKQVIDGFKRSKTREIEERLKRGQRLIPIGLQF